MDERRNVHSEATPHQDGRRESVMNDDIGVEIGVRSDAKNAAQFTTLTEIQDPQMKKFEQTIRGKPVKE
ncbi:hypothetical protein P5G51_001285 [Virgibacillus sp. 179-BFC.A HS]|uniref:Uncharacterized protein n=1 Tax=Tigheibacillus jepli TaxID=3035914 RepID=A0ABU5CD10_9BACI|nr:hypothetical protein [Virgibacillus sp. 179-BFC.A HS]MDY0404222.1 hypothetical protein [Virgibacillus sp. 179-BFC.A HS]